MLEGASAEARFTTSVLRHCLMESTLVQRACTVRVCAASANDKALIPTPLPLGGIEVGPLRSGACARRQMTGAARGRAADQKFVALA